MYMETKKKHPFVTEAHIRYKGRQDHPDLGGLRGSSREQSASMRVGGSGGAHPRVRGQRGPVTATENTILC